jgi:hypothetical protein
MGFLGFGDDAKDGFGRQARDRIFEGAQAESHRGDPTTKAKACRDREL